MPDSAFPIPDMAAIVGHRDVVLITLDTLRHDAAQRCFERDELKVLGPHLGASGWERRHSPASFTYAAHQAFFAGFLPTEAEPGLHPRLFALAFPGSATTHAQTCVFSGQADIVAGFAARGYHTLCIGGTGFFNRLTPLGNVLPQMFAEAHWQPAFGVAARDSTAHQVSLAVARLQSADLADRRCFLFLNVSALHQPNHHYVEGALEDSLETHCAALAYADGALAPLFDALRARGGAFVIACSDHGTAYGEDGYHGHRHAHAVVMTVPYAHFLVA